MSARTIGIIAAVLVLSGTVSGAAQTVITFEVPVNLTQVPSDIDKVGVACIIFGDGLTSTASSQLSGALSSPANIFASQIPSAGPSWVKQEWPVMSAQVVVSLRLNLAISAEYLDTPLGKTATYVCLLGGYSKSLQKWDMFDAAHTVPAFRLAPTPPGIQGTFVW